MSGFYSIPFFILLMCLSCSEKSNTYDKMEEMSISGVLTWQDQYCGGAPPNEAFLRQKRRTQALSDFPLYVKEGLNNRLDVNPILSFRTDSLGRFSFVLPKGNYVLLQKEQLNRKILEEPIKQIQIVDKKALEEWWKQGLRQISKDSMILNVHFKKKCHIPLGVPYLQYQGPLAP
jgi:hypothetical protein